MAMQLAGKCSLFEEMRRGQSLDYVASSTASRLLGPLPKTAAPARSQLPVLSQPTNTYNTDISDKCIGCSRQSECITDIPGVGYVRTPDYKSC